VTRHHHFLHFSWLEEEVEEPEEKMVISWVELFSFCHYHFADDVLVAIVVLVVAAPLHFFASSIWQLAAPVVVYPVAESALDLSKLVHRLVDWLVAIENIQARGDWIVAIAREQRVVRELAVVVVSEKDCYYYDYYYFYYYGAAVVVVVVVVVGVDAYYCYRLLDLVCL
jgi:hypothetical protein